MTTETGHCEPSSILAVQPMLSPPRDAEIHFGGFIGERLRANEEEWLLKVRAANPAMIESFYMRDRLPRAPLVPWHGEYPGKILTGAVLCWRISHSSQLAAEIVGLVADLADVQDEDGYLGPHPRHERLTGSIWNATNKLWDIWGHYHCMLGLYLWYMETHDRTALTVCLKAANLLCRTFLDSGLRVHDASWFPTDLNGSYEMNMSISHIMCLLYEEIGDVRYLRLAQEVLGDWERPPAGDYLRTALQGLEFYQTPKPRWESLHTIETLAEIYFITGDDDYRRALEHIWTSIVQSDRHNTGAFSSYEQAVGNPYDRRGIETCCVVAWMVLTLDVLRMTGWATAADELELTTFNAMLGAQHPSGRWWTYDTPMDGERKAFYHMGNGQCVPGGPELSCCFTNAARGLGLLSQWSIMSAANGIAINYYGPGTFVVTTPSEQPMLITQNTGYPLGGEIRFSVSISVPERFAIRLRIPGWSAKTTVIVNDQSAGPAVPGTYLELERIWRDGDRIALVLDMSYHFWVGQKECQGYTSIYRGPLLLAYDQRYNSMDADEVPTLDGERLSVEPVPWTRTPLPWLLYRFKAVDGRPLLLCDFATAGMAGTHYRSWLPVRNVAEVGFSFGKMA